MTHDFDEPRSWLEPALEVDELRQLLENVKLALESHDGPLFAGDLGRAAGPSAAPVTAALRACNDNRQDERGEPSPAP